MKIKVFYDFHDDAIKPMIMVIRFRRGEIQWDKSMMTVRLDAPFRRQTLDEYDDGIVGLSVHIEDLAVNLEMPGCFRVDLASLRARCTPNELDEIEQFVIRMADIEEVLQMDARQYFDWRDDQ